MEFKRVRRTRTHKLPPNTKCVDRSSKLWGNPFKVGTGKGEYSLEKSLELYKVHIREKIKNKEVDLNDIRDKNLACWCALNSPCHVDILFKILAENPVKK